VQGVVCPRWLLGARATPVRRAGAVFECVHSATRAVVAVKLLFAITRAVPPVRRDARLVVTSVWMCVNITSVGLLGSRENSV
jgi:hypothetical protein